MALILGKAVSGGGAGQGAGIGAGRGGGVLCTWSESKGEIAPSAMACKSIDNRGKKAKLAFTSQYKVKFVYPICMTQ